jgi:hypothetical protein
MKILAKILLVLVSIPVFFLCILSINVRFQLLSSRFWINTFEKNAVYSQISAEIGTRLTSKVVAGGGEESDITVLSALVSTDNLKYFFEKNIQSFISYANGKSSEITIFIPFSSELGDFSEEISLMDFLDEFNIAVVSESDIQMISKYGFFSWMAFVALLTLLVLIFVLLYLLTDSGKSLVSQGMAFILFGTTLTMAFFIGQFAGEVISRDFTGSSNIGTSLMAIITPPIIQNLIRTWIWIGILLFIFGILLFFIKKPAIFKSK